MSNALTYRGEAAYPSWNCRIGPAQFEGVIKRQGDDKRLWECQGHTHRTLIEALECSRAEMVRLRHTVYQRRRGEEIMHVVDLKHPEFTICLKRTVRMHVGAANTIVVVCNVCLPFRAVAAIAV